MNASWTEERVEKLIQLHSDGCSASIIAEQLGHTTRNAVIGKLNRLGLASKRGRPSVVRERKVVPRARPRRSEIVYKRFVIPAFKAQPLPEIEDENIPVEQRKQLLDLTPETCRWPVGDPCSKDFFFCGGETFMDFPYCSAHCRIAYQPPAARKTTKDRGRDWNIGTFKKAAA